MSSSSKAGHKAYRDWFKLRKLLIKLNKEYRDLRMSDFKDSSSFDESVIRFSRTLSAAKRKISELVKKHKASSILEINFDEGALNLNFKSPSYKFKLAPIAVPPILLRELMEKLRFPRITSKADQFSQQQQKERESNLLSPKEASKMLGVSYKTLWRWWKEGKIKAVRLPSRHLRYLREEIEQIIHK